MSDQYKIDHHHAFNYKLHIFKMNLLLIIHFSLLCITFLHYLSQFLTVAKKFGILRTILILISFHDNYLIRKPCIWSEEWEKISRLEPDKIKDIIDEIFPILKKGNISKRSFFYTSKNIPQYRPDFFEQETKLDWPDESYYRSLHKTDLYNKGDFLMGQKYVQHILWKRQHPNSCQNKKIVFLDDNRNAGLGAFIHGTAVSMSLYMDDPDVIFMWAPWVKYQWAKGEYCSNYSTLNCFFEPITNCTFHLDDNGEFHNYIITTPFSSQFKLPQFLENILNKSLVHKDLYEWYWLASISTYIFRFNKRTYNWLDVYEKTNLVNPNDRYDIGIHVRHGDKYKEMILIDEKKYMSAVDIFCKITGKNRKDMNLFVSSEDPNVIKFFIEKSGCSVSYFKYERKNENLTEMVLQGALFSLKSFANLRMSIRTHFRADTFASNWDRLILELAQTTACHADIIALEMGYSLFLSADHYDTLKDLKLVEPFALFKYRLKRDKNRGKFLMNPY